jgi:hypothetical protein
MKKIVFSSICLMLLSACGLTRADLGMEKESPDEMMVVSRAPLSIPPEFGLRPLVVTDDAEKTEDLTTGEKALLQKMK